MTLDELLAHAARHAVTVSEAEYHMMISDHDRLVEARERASEDVWWDPFVEDWVSGPGELARAESEWDAIVEHVNARIAS